MDTETGTAVPRSPVSVRVQLRGHSVLQDKPAGSGGTDEGPMSSELLLASLLACQHSTFVKVAAKRRLEARVERLEGAVHFDAAGDITRFDVLFHLTSAGADEAIRNALRLTEQACTVSKSLKPPVHVDFRRVAGRAAL